MLRGLRRLAIAAASGAKLLPAAWSPLSHRRRGLEVVPAFVVALMVAACVGAVSPNPSPTTTASFAAAALESDAPSAADSLFPEVSAAAASPSASAVDASAEPSSSPPATATPRASSTPRPTGAPSPTPRPTPAPSPTPKPTPQPTWPPDAGWSMGEKSPVVSGGQADVSVHIFAGPTCSGTVKYPSGGTHTLAAHTFSKLSTYDWKWTLPSSAGLGTATLTVRCTLGSVTKAGPGSFTITPPPTPTPAPGLGVIIDQPAPGKIEFYIGTHGTIADVCYIDLTPPSGPAPARATVHPTNDQPVWIYDMGTAPTGTWGWTVECVWGTTHLSKSGTFDAS